MRGPITGGSAYDGVPTRGGLTQSNPLFGAKEEYINNYIAPGESLTYEEWKLNNPLTDVEQARVAAGEYAFGEVGFLDSGLYYLEQVGNYLTGLFLFIILVDKFFIKKDYAISKSEFWFIVLLLLKIQFPIVSIITAALSLPPALKSVKGWFKNNVNKRKELEAELKLMYQV